MVERASPKRLAVVRFQPSPAIGNIRVHFGDCSKPKSGRKKRKMRSYVGLQMRDVPQQWVEDPQLLRERRYYYVKFQAGGNSTRLSNQTTIQMCQDIDKHNAVIATVMQTTKTDTDKCKAWSVCRNSSL